MANIELKYHHLASDALPPESSGHWLRVASGGRPGWLAGSVHSRAILEGHTVNVPRGALTVWAMAMDDLSIWSQPQFAREEESDYCEMVLLSEYVSKETSVRDADGRHVPGPLRNWREASFCLVWQAYWYPSLAAKFFRSGIYNAPEGVGSQRSAYDPKLTAIVTVDHWSPRATSIPSGAIRTARSAVRSW